MEISETGRKSPKRLLINISEEQHAAIKNRAANRNITLRKWVTRAILEAIKKEQAFE